MSLDWGISCDTRSHDPPEARKFVGLGSGVSRSDQQKTTENMLGPKLLRSLPRRDGSAHPEEVRDPAPVTSSGVKEAR